MTGIICKNTRIFHSLTAKIEEMKKKQRDFPMGQRDLGCCYKICGNVLIRANDLLVLKNSITFEPSFVISFHHKTSGSFICYYIIDIKFHVEVKGETKNHISYLTTIGIWKQHSHFLALSQQVL